MSTKCKKKLPSKTFQIIIPNFSLSGLSKPSMSPPLAKSFHARQLAGSVYPVIFFESTTLVVWAIQILVIQKRVCVAAFKYFIRFFVLKLLNSILLHKINILIQKRLWKEKSTI